MLAVPIGGAQAQDAAAVADRLKATFATQGIDLTWTGVVRNGDTIELDGVSFGMANPAAMGTPAMVGKVTLSGVTEQAGGFKVGSMTFPEYKVTNAGMDVQISGAQISGLTLPAAGSTDPLASMMMYERGQVASAIVGIGGKPIVTVTDLNVEVTPPADGKPLTFEGAVEKFTADLSGVADPKSKAVIEALGYTTLAGFFEMAGSYQPTDGRITLSRYNTTVENAGTLGLNMDLGGYTPAFMTAMQDMQKKMAEQPAGTDNSAQGMAMLGLMQQLTFHGASIRFEDASLTGKILEYVGKQQGVKASDVANQAKAIAPFLLAQLNNPELTASATAALTKFFDDPKSFEISAQPAAPVPFALIAAGAMSTPQDLPKTLGVTVTANE